MLSCCISQCNCGNDMMNIGFKMFIFRKIMDNIFGSYQPVQRQQLVQQAPVVPPVPVRPMIMAPVPYLQQIQPFRFNNNNFYSNTNLLDTFRSSYNNVRPLSSKVEEEDGDDEDKKVSKTTKKAEKVETKEQQLTPAMVNELISGTYSAPYVKINGVTHYKYSDCKASDLVVVNSGVSNGKLHKNAANAFKKMQQAAKADGINLSVISGFRSTATQKGTFTRKGRDIQTIKNRVKLSAPPGYSEHHTGYAMDINSVDSKDFRKGGKDYKAYQWLLKHAKEYGFEQSFSTGNSQGVATEEWHWRYVGDETAKEIFKTARANA